MALLEMFKENILNIQNESTNYLEIDSSNGNSITALDSTLT